MTTRNVFEEALKQDRYDTVTRLAFSDWLEEHGLDDEAHEQRRMATPEWQEADRWMRELAAEEHWHWKNYPGEEDQGRRVTYEDLLAAGHDYVDSDGELYWVQLGSESLRNRMDKATSEKYWQCWSILADRDKPTGDKRYGLGTAPFSCSC